MFLKKRTLLPYFNYANIDIQFKAKVVKQMLITSILTSLVQIFILILPGLFCRKKNIISEEQNAGLSSVVVNLTWPCLVIDAMQIPFDSQVMADSARITVVTLAIFAVLAIASIPLAKMLRVSKTKQYLIMFMLLFGNTGFIGLPVIKALYGADALFYAAIVEVINDVLLFTVGIMLIQLSAGAQLKMDPKQIISPGLIGVLIGLVLFLLNIQLPEILAKPIAMVGDATTPLTMFAIGGQLAALKLKEIAGDWKVYGVIFIRLLIIPLIALAIVRLFAGEFTLLEKVIVVSFAMPAAAASAIFSQQYKGEEAFATKSVLMTTVCSIITIPIFAIIMEL